MSRNAFPQIEREYNERLSEQEERKAERAGHHGINLMTQPVYRPDQVNVARPGAQDHLKIRSIGGTAAVYRGDRGHA